jgi:hypothetical protein
MKLFTLEMILLFILFFATIYGSENRQGSENNSGFCTEITEACRESLHTSNSDLDTMQLLVKNFYRCCCCCDIRPQQSQHVTFEHEKTRLVILGEVNPAQEPLIGNNNHQIEVLFMGNS